MTKKSKKAKTPKAPKGRGGNGGGKDPVTGLSWEFYVDNPDKYARFESDKTYSLEELNKIYSLAGQPAQSRFKSQQKEIELSNQYLVETNKTEYNENSSTIERLVISGIFEYDKGSLRSATFKALASETIRIENGNVVSRTGFINASPRGARLSNAKSYKEFLSIGAMTDFAPQAAFESNELDGSFSIGTASDKETISNFGNGNLLREGWWLDPFTPNLI